MGFDLEAFAAADFKERTRDVEIDADSPLASCFTGDGPRVWTLRALTGRDLAVVNEAVDAARNIEGLVAALSGRVPDVGAIKQALGIDDKIKPSDYVRRLRLLKLGSVAPVITDAHAVKIANVAPVEFQKLTNTVLELTGQGWRLGE